MDESLSAKAGDRGSIPGLGNLHMLQGLILQINY